MINNNTKEEIKNNAEQAKDYIYSLIDSMNEARAAGNKMAALEYQKNIAHITLEWIHEFSCDDVARLRETIKQHPEFDIDLIVLDNKITNSPSLHEEVEKVINVAPKNISGNIEIYTRFLGLSDGSFSLKVIQSIINNGNLIKEFERNKLGKKFFYQVLQDLTDKKFCNKWADDMKKQLLVDIAKRPIISEYINQEALDAILKIERTDVLAKIDLYERMVMVDSAYSIKVLRVNIYNCTSSLLIKDERVLEFFSRKLEVMYFMELSGEDAKFRDEFCDVLEKNIHIKSYRNNTAD